MWKCRRPMFSCPTNTTKASDSSFSHSSSNHFVLCLYVCFCVRFESVASFSTSTPHQAHQLQNQSSDLIFLQLLWWQLAKLFPVLLVLLVLLHSLLLCSDHLCQILTSQQWSPMTHPQNKLSESCQFSAPDSTSTWLQVCASADNITHLQSEGRSDWECRPGPVWESLSCDMIDILYDYMII